MLSSSWWRRSPNQSLRPSKPRRRKRPRFTGHLPSVEILEDRTVPSTIRTITYDQITTQPSSLQINGDAPYNVLSADGSRAVFSAGSPGHVYTVRSDGSGQTLIDSNASDLLDISADGSVVLESIEHGAQGWEFRVVNADGSNPHTAFQTTYAPGIASRLSADGQTVFFEDESGFTIGTQFFAPGVYAVPAAGGGTPTLIASDAQVAALLGTTASNITMLPGEGIDLDVSADAQRLVFGAARNGVGEFLLGVERNDPSSLHTIGPLPVAPGVGVSEAGISADGGTVFRYDTSSSLPAPRLTVYHFDGSGQLTLNVPAGLYALTAGPEHVQLTADGSKLLLGTSGLLLNTDNSGAVQIGTHADLSGGYGLVHAMLYHPTMNGAGTEFLYTFRDRTATFQLAVAHLNPTDLGGDPAISNISISPPYLLTELRSTTTISATVSAGSTPVGVDEEFLRGSVAEYEYPDGYDFTDGQLYNDGTYGSTLGSSTYTSNNVTISYDPPPGPRTVRVSAGTVDGSGLQHLTAVEVDGITVIAPGPTHLNFIEPGTVTAGVPFQITVQVLDSNQHLVTGYLGTVQFTTSNGAMASYTFQPGDMGQHTFTIPLRQAGRLEVLGIDAADHTIAGSTSFTVVAAAADHIALVLVTSSVTAGSPFSLTVTVQDAYGNTVTGYQGTVHFQLTGPVMPSANYTFTGADRGSHTFSGLVLNQTGMYTLMATDSAGPLLSGMLAFTVS
jgi:hypothetical protein